MSNEITHNAPTGLTLYTCRFQPNGNVFLTNGASDEVWGTAGRDADDYDVTMTEEDGSGHYKGNFDTSANITDSGAYPVAVYRQLGGNPADSDPAIAQGEQQWDGTAEINLVTLDADIALIVVDQDNIKNVYGADASTAEGTNPEVVL